MSKSRARRIGPAGSLALHVAIRLPTRQRDVSWTGMAHRSPNFWRRTALLVIVHPGESTGAC